MSVRFELKKDNRFKLESGAELNNRKRHEIASAPILECPWTDER